MSESIGPYQILDLVVTEPVYVVVDRPAGAARASAGLPVQEVVLDSPQKIRVYRTPAAAVAKAEPHTSRH